MSCLVKIDFSKIATASFNVYSRYGKRGIHLQELAESLVLTVAAFFK
jgi:hypothetical protein